MDNSIYILDNEQLNVLTSFSNRSNGQTQLLFQLLEGDYEKLLLLERKIKETFCSYCPDTKDEVEKILSQNEQTR